MGANTVQQSEQLPPKYNPSDVEDRIYRFWSENGYFHAEPEQPGEVFSVVIPPPNVTDRLHLGHALNNSLQDVLVRWHRMQGHNTVWIPGTDHAGIATQVRVEARLRQEEGKTRHDLGREEFLRRVWEWKEKYGGLIIEQLKRLGSSCDWQRERFTLDEGCSRAVREVFVELYNKGLIYSGEYIVNWCPECRTALSDIEVEHKEDQSKLWHIRYPLVDASGTSEEHIVVATTRPETMLGDTAVAVNPDDERYKHLVGRQVKLPLTDRVIPIIADEYVNPEFGSGMVKVTPAHDPNDFEMGERHDLPRIAVIDEDGRMTEEAGPKYAGMPRYECRRAVVEDLQAAGLLAEVEDYTHSVGHCYRCDNAVEPLVSKQWFVKMKPLARPAIQAVEEGKTEFVPARFAKIYNNWLENIRDWCISRQLWWGHRIPVWYCQDCDEVIVAKVDPTKCSKCGSTRLEQDPDVLDTWFSSALWPFSTLGWPEQTADLKSYYPTSVLVTAFDIIFFWVARMMFMGLEFMGEVPFHHVLIHGLVRDPQGRKMSKSLGNGVDPIEVIEEYGADALRFALVTGVSPGNDTRYQPEKVEAARNFCNKIWNAARFSLMNLQDFDPVEAERRELEPADRWILSRFQRAAGETHRLLGRFDIGEAARVLYDYVWGEFCDWYIEMIKPRLYGHLGEETRRTAQSVLYEVLKGTLKLLHPFVPFITEEIWSKLPGDDGALITASWPQADPALRDKQLENEMSLLIDVIRSIRNIRGEKKVAPSKEIPVQLHADADKREILQRNEVILKRLAGLSEVVLAQSGDEMPRPAVTAVAGGVEVYVPLAGLVDLDEERRRLRAELEEAEKNAAASRSKLANENFVTKAPAEVVERERQRLAELEETLAKLRRNLEELEVV